MDTFTLVRPEHLNHHGYLFGGVMLKWVDENAWMAASREYPNSTLVTVGMDACRFKHPVDNGSILRFHIKNVKKGRTSATYNVTVYAEAPEECEEKEVFSTSVSFVHLNKKGRPCVLPPESAES